MNALSTNTAGERGLARKYGVAVLVVLALATALRAYGIGKEPLWIDEIATLRFSVGRPAGTFTAPFDVLQSPGFDQTGLAHANGWGDVIGAVARDTHPPLHPLVLRAWRLTFGEGDVAARSLSAVCSLLAVALLFDVCRMLHGRSVAVWAATIMAVATPQIVFAHEARSYAMLVLFVLAAADLLVRIEVHGPSAWKCLMLTAAALAAMMTHYLALPVCAAMTVYALILPNRNPDSSSLRAASARTTALASLASAGVLFLLLWGATAWSQRPQFIENLDWTADEDSGHLARTVDRLLLLPVRWLITPKISDTDSWIVRFGAVLYLAPLLLWRTRAVLLWVLLGASIVATAALSDGINQRRTLEILRFTMPAAPAAYALIAAAAFSLLKRSWLAHAIPAAIALGCLAAIPEAYDRYWKPDYRTFTREFDQFAGPDDVIIAIQESRKQDWYASMLVSAVTRYTAHPSRPLLVLTRQASPELQAKLREAPGVWLLTQQPDPRAQALLPGWQAARGGITPFVGVYTELKFNPPASSHPIDP